MRQAGSAVGKGLFGRSVSLFFNFLLVILAYYQVKAASRSLLIEFGGPDAFPYVWIGSAAVLLGFIGVYNRLVARFSRIQIVTGSLMLFALLLVLFWFLLRHGGIYSAVTFYIFVDIFSVVLVEQFWSLSNTINRQEEGRRSYWFIASGGLIGGIAGGALSASLIAYTPMQTADLLLSCALLLVVTAAFTLNMWRRGLFEELSADECMKLDGEGLAALFRSRYLILIAVIICFSQLAEPVVEYQFLHAISEHFPDRDLRTRYISHFFSVLGLVAVAINMFVTPFVHRRLGALAGLMVQPLSICVASVGFMLHSTLNAAAIMKISDRGLSYSINRASKELLYIPVDPVNTYQVKAWIDMLGYRLFKVLGSGLILVATQWSLVQASADQLGWLTLAICAAWIVAIRMLATEQRAVGLVAPG